MSWLLFGIGTGMGIAAVFAMWRAQEWEWEGRAWDKVSRKVKQIVAERGEINGEMVGGDGDD